MPTYEYQCKTCGHRFDYFQSITADALTHCPVEECPREGEQKGKGEVERRISSGAGLVFKGEGFYLTDYVRKGQSKGKESGSGGGSGSSSGGSGSSSSDSSSSGSSSS